MKDEHGAKVEWQVELGRGEVAAGLEKEDTLYTLHIHLHFTLTYTLHTLYT